MNRNALITGGSKGIGLAVKNRLESKSVKVIAPTRSEMDLRSNASIDSFMKNLDMPIHILINNAGINKIALAIETNESDINETVQVNLLAPLRIAKFVLPQMVRQKYGRIVNTSSIWGLVTKAGRITYSMTKSGIIGMTRTLAVEFGPHNILINALAPGYVNTELTIQNNTPEQIEAIKQTIPIGRLAEPEEIAETISFLVSEKNTYITGQLIIVDGGYLCL